MAFEAREDKRVDKRSGVSQRLPISVLENAVSNAERPRPRCSARTRVVPRLSDVYAAVPSITGKLELEYEGELQGGDAIARELIRRAAGKVLEDRMGGADLAKIVAWFDQGGALKVPGDERAELCFQGFSVVPGLVDVVAEFGLAPRSDHPRAVAACELVLEGLAAQKRISRSEELGYTRHEAGAAGAGVWEGRDLVRVRTEGGDGRQAKVGTRHPERKRGLARLDRSRPQAPPLDATAPLVSALLRLPSSAFSVLCTHPIPRARATTISVAPSKPSTPVLSTM